MIAQASVQEVISRADIVEIIGGAVRLKKRGSNYLANCPFHNEKTPSFSVSASKGFYKCFGCGRGGNVVTFVQEYEKLTFVEAIRWLADYYKIDLQERSERRSRPPASRSRNGSPACSMSLPPNTSRRRFAKARKAKPLAFPISSSAVFAARPSRPSGWAIVRMRGMCSTKPPDSARLQRSIAGEIRPHARAERRPLG